jgi:thiol-disulfide isomerase/thioredoxin
MKPKSLLLVLTLCLGVLMLCQVAWVAADTEPTVGTNLGNVSFSAPITADDAKYLGLSSAAPFHLGDIKSPYVLIESFNTTCPHCMAQAPVLNVLYGKVQSDSALKGKVKFISAGQGNELSAVQMWKKFHKVPFAVVPDTDRKLSKAMNFGPYPVTMLVDKNGKVLWVEVGQFENVDSAFSGIKKAVK